MPRLSSKARIVSLILVLFIGAAAVAAFHSEPIGWATMIVLVLVAGLANAYLDLRDPSLGIALGSIIAVLVGATLSGSGISLLASLGFALVGLLVGYAFGALKVTANDDAGANQTSQKLKSGKGGDFDGGGAGGSF